MFWNHSKQHSSKTYGEDIDLERRFGTIRNNTALKHEVLGEERLYCFGTIRNNTALKQSVDPSSEFVCFGTIRNNTALKPRGPFFLTKFRNRAICLSLTSAPNDSLLLLFYSPNQRAISRSTDSGESEP